MPRFKIGSLVSTQERKLKRRKTPSFIVRGLHALLYIYTTYSPALLHAGERWCIYTNVILWSCLHSACITAWYEQVCCLFSATFAAALRKELLSELCHDACTRKWVHRVCCPVSVTLTQLLPDRHTPAICEMDAPAAVHIRMASLAQALASAIPDPSGEMLEGSVKLPACSLTLGGTPSHF